MNISSPYQGLATVLGQFRKHKQELLVVLNQPSVPLHNNTAERDLRTYVIKRKISGSTRVDLGRQARDTFTSLIKTCQKNKISFWHYLDDRIRHLNQILPLDQVILQRSLSP